MREYQDEAQRLWADLLDLDARIEMALEALRCPPADAPVAKLSGGVAVIRATSSTKRAPVMS